MQKNHRTCLAPCQWPHATTHYTTLREADLRIVASTLNSIRCLAQFYRVEEWELQVQAASQSWWRAYERMGLWYFRLLWGGREGTQRQRTRLRNALGRCASWALLVGRGWLWGPASSCHPRGEVRIGKPPQLQLRLLCSVWSGRLIEFVTRLICWIRLTRFRGASFDLLLSFITDGFDLLGRQQSVVEDRPRCILDIAHWMGLQFFRLFRRTLCSPLRSCSDCSFFNERLIDWTMSILKKT
jgi:hypothetical protein